jgi:hypothetical protein
MIEGFIVLGMIGALWTARCRGIGLLHRWAGLESWFGPLSRGTARCIPAKDDLLLRSTNLISALCGEGPGGGHPHGMMQPGLA